MNDNVRNPGHENGTAQSDEQLMLAFSRGSTDAFKELFLRYKQPVFGFFRRRIADPAQAEELTQETFLAIIRACARYEPRAMFSTYIFAISLRILRAYRRKAALRAALFGAEPRPERPNLRSDGQAELILRQAVGKLERIDREVLLLREFEQLSYAQIAELLALPLNTVRSRLFRARIALRDLLAPPVRQSTPAVVAEPEECP